MRQRTLLMAGLLGLALQAGAVTHDVMIMGFAFSPANLTIQVGDTVRWTNHDFAPHTATALNGLFNSGTISSGNNWSRTFNAAGTTNYRCNFHVSMTGTINVVSPLATVSGAITLQSYDPSPAGQQVTFEVRDGLSVVDTKLVTLGAGGAYSFTTTQSGSRAIAAKASHWLSKSSGNVTLSAGGTTNVSLTLLNGDSDGDNEVGIGDYAIISGAYNSGPGDANWDARGDLNGDDAVDIADYAILSQNYGLMGE
jgi:plastocyanin